MSQLWFLDGNLLWVIQIKRDRRRRALRKEGSENLNPPLEADTLVYGADTVQKAVTTASIMSHLKNNRIEYLLAIGISHLLGLTDVFWTHASTVC